MAYIRKATEGWRAEVQRAGVRSSRTFDTKREAQQWAVAEEAALLASKRGQYPRRTLAEAMDRYLRDVSPSKAGKQAEVNEGRRFKAFKRDYPALAGKVLSEIRTPDMVAWRDARLKVVTRGTVQRDVNLLSNLFRIAQREWKWCGDSPLTGMRQPGQNPARSRMIGWREARAMLRALHYRPGQAPALKLQEVGHAFALALRTGMRLGELLVLTDQHVDLVRRVATVPHKMQYLTGRPREVPLSTKAIRIIKPLMGRGNLIQVSSASLDALFRKTRDQVGLAGFTFHDSRATALTHMARRVDVMTLARVSGHKDIRVLTEHYYRETADSIASRLR